MAIDLIPCDLLWLGRGGVFGGGAGRRGGGVFGAGRGGRGRAGSRGGELFYGDGDEVGGDVGDHHVLAARCHFGVPVGVPLGRHPFRFGRGGALVARGNKWKSERLAVGTTLEVCPHSLLWHGSVQCTILIFVFQGRRGGGGDERRGHRDGIWGQSGSRWLGALAL